MGPDANGLCQFGDGSYSEAVSWDTDPPAGTYSVWVVTYDQCDATEVSYNVTVSVDGSPIGGFDQSGGYTSGSPYEFALP